MIDNMEITIAVIGIILTALSIALPNYLAKKNEIQNQVRERKLERYDDLIEKFTKFLDDPSDKQSTFNFIEAYNKSSAYASEEVLESCHKLLEAIRGRSQKRQNNSNYTISDKEQDELLISDVFTSIRKDVSSKDTNFKFRGYVQ